MREASEWEGVSGVDIDIPGVAVLSELNRRDHYFARYRRFKKQKNVVGWELKAALSQGNLKLSLPLKVTLTRVGGQTMDDDNLAGAFKGVRDIVAKVLGFNDGDTRCEWRYAQRAAKWKGINVKIEEV